MRKRGGTGTSENLTPYLHYRLRLLSQQPRPYKADPTVRRLEKMGLVARGQAVDDQPEVFLFAITDAGRAALSRDVAGIGGTDATGYVLVRLAPGSYDIVLHGKVVASLVNEPNRAKQSAVWTAELLSNVSEGERPKPFSEKEHRFDSLTEACAWLGVARPG